MTEKVRAGRNRTLVVTEDEKRILSQKLINLSEYSKVEKNDILDKTILGDLLEVIDKIPNEIADLIIIDPPYNLSKDFNGYKFKSLSNEEYLKYLCSWFPKVASKLKPKDRKSVV